MEQGTRETRGEATDDGGGDGGAGGAVGPKRQVIRWDQILPRRSLRVLLVEHDDSTRQEVTALLRKCSYHGKSSCSRLLPPQFGPTVLVQFELIFVWVYKVVGRNSLALLILLVLPSDS